MSILVQQIRDTNRRLSFHLGAIRARSQQPMAPTPQLMGALLSELLAAGAGLRAQPLPAPGVDHELDRALAEYRGHVEHLRDLLPSIHKELLAERVRIEERRSRLLSVGEWASASRQTL
jgi:hypothetical protein